MRPHRFRSGTAATRYSTYRKRFEEKSTWRTLAAAVSDAFLSPRFARSVACASHVAVQRSTSDTEGSFEKSRRHALRIQAEWSGESAHRRAARAFATPT